jgi:glyoxylase-like metal-dependent hydrolase (beta-lactamase superfamily II)
MTAPLTRVGTASRWVIALALMLAGQWAHGLLAEQRAAGNTDKADGTDKAKVAALETLQIRSNVYVIFGAGGNVAVHLGEDGVILVDSGSAAMADALLNAVKAITTQRIRMIINTSADVDHVGGNDKLGAAGVAINPDAFSDEEHATVLAHENVLQRLSAPKGNDTLFPVAMWPNETFTSKFRSMYVNDEAIQVMREIGAHSDGDSMVFFRRADVIATGDILDLRQFPVIDPARGGSIQGELASLNRLLDVTLPAVPLVLKPGRTLLVPGHGRISDYGELVEYRDMVTVIRDIIGDMIGKGMTLEQVKAANPTQGYRRRYGADSGPWTTDMFVEAIYNGLKKPAGKS